MELTDLPNIGPKLADNLRQVGVGTPEQLRKLVFYGGTLLCFHLGAAWGWWCVKRWGIPGIYGCLPLLVLPAVFLRAEGKNTAVPC